MYQANKSFLQWHDLSSMFQTMEGPARKKAKQEPSLKRTSSGTQSIVPTILENPVTLPVASTSAMKVPKIDDTMIITTCLGLQTELHPLNFVPSYCCVCDRNSLCGIDIRAWLMSHPKLKILAWDSSFEMNYHHSMPCQISSDGTKYFLHRILKDRRDPYVLVCNECQSDLEDDQIPLFSIMNYMYAEPIPSELQQLTLAESVLLARVYPRSIVVQCKNSGKNVHSYAKGHIVSFANDVGNMTSIIPRPRSELPSLLKVVVAGPGNMNIKLAKINRVRKSEMENAANWLIRNNVGYNDVVLSRAWNDEHHDREELEETVEHGTVEDFLRRIPSHAKFEKCEEEADWEQNSNQFSISDFTTSCTYTDASETQSYTSIKIQATLNTWINQTKEGLSAIAHGGEIMDIYGSCDWIPLMYCVLFPFGVCGPTSPRSRPVDLHRWVRYYLTCRDSRFREHPDFIYVIFNIIQRQKVSEMTRYALWCNW